MTSLTPTSERLVLSPSTLDVRTGSRNSPRPTWPTWLPRYPTGPFAFSLDSNPSNNRPSLRPTTQQLPTLTLRRFLRDAWPQVEASPRIHAWYLDAVAEHLEAVSTGQIRDLILNQPPRTGKSLTVSVCWPAWTWTFAPHSRWLFSSYALSLAIRDTLRARRLITSPWYQRRWGSLTSAPAFALLPDQNQKSRYDNDHGGYRLATSVGGSNTGEGADYLVSDDPHNVADGESLAVLEATATWWNEVMPSRRNDPAHSARVVVQQRVHDRDVTGVSLEQGGWHLLRLPMEYEPPAFSYRHDTEEDASAPASDVCSLTGQPHDPRTEPGTLLDPARFPPSVVSDLKRQLGSYAWAGQYQQDPVPRAGAILDPNWLRPLPPLAQRGTTDRVQFWDLAWSEKQSADYTCAVTLDSNSLDHLYVVSVLRGQFDGRAQEDTDGPTRLDLVMADHIATTRPGLVGVELGAYQQAATQRLIARVRSLLKDRGLGMVPVVGVAIQHDKVLRARVLEAPGQAGELYADHTAPWWHTFAAELSRFPRGAHDDQVDSLVGACSLAYEHLRTRRALRSSRGQGGLPIHRGLTPPTVPSVQPGKTNPFPWPSGGVVRA